jgi:hypothetical protein
VVARVDRHIGQKEMRHHRPAKLAPSRAMIRRMSRGRCAPGSTQNRREP